MFPGDAPQSGAESLLLFWAFWLGQAVGGAVLADDPAGAALGDPETLSQGLDGPAAAFRGQKFPVMMTRALVDVA
jgi:hypothetical protein